VRPPPITITCDCGAIASVAYGDKWRCEACDKTWDTSQIPSGDYDELLRGVKHYRLLAIGPPIVLAAILIPLAIFVGAQFAFLLFVLVAAYGLLVVPPLRRRATRRLGESVRSWKLSPE